MKLKSFDFGCDDCQIVLKDIIIDESVNEEVRCPNCAQVAHRLPVGGPKNYRIWGDNSGSTTPKQFGRLN